MNYIGSKHKLSDFIVDTIEKTSGDLKGKVFCDIFAGTGIIPRKVKTKVKQIIANDFEKYNQYNLVYNHKSLNNDVLIKLKNLGYIKFYFNIRNFFIIFLSLTSFFRK